MSLARCVEAVAKTLLTTTTRGGKPYMHYLVFSFKFKRWKICVLFYTIFMANGIIVTD